MNENLQKFKFQLQQIPILQESTIDVMLINEGLAAPPFNFTSSSSESQFQLQYDDLIVPRVDLFSTAVKETYPQIVDVPSLAQFFTKNNISAKNADKNALTNAQQKFSAFVNNPFACKMHISFKPKVSG